MWVCLFDEHDGVEQETRHALTERSLGIWHGALPGVPPGQRYGFRADGPWDPDQGLRFNPNKLLLDPYARAVSGEFVTDPAIFGFEAGDDLRATSTPHRARRARLRAVRRPQRGRARRLRLGRRPARSAPAGATRPSTSCTSRASPRCTTGSPRSCAGRTPGSATAWSPTTSATSASPRSSCCRSSSSSPSRRLAEHGLANYWGYNTIGFFAPHAAYSSSGDRGEQVARVQADGEELPRGRDRGHTSTSSTTTPPRPDVDGPTLSFRGLDDLGFYKRASTTGREDRPAHTGHLLGRHRVRQHRQRREPDGAAADHGLAALLGHRDARRRLPVRPDVGADPHRARRST